MTDENCFCRTGKGLGWVLRFDSAELPEHYFEATSCFEIDTLRGIDVLIPTMSSVSRKLLETADFVKDSIPTSKSEQEGG